MTTDASTAAGSATPTPTPRPRRRWRRRLIILLGLVFGIGLGAGVGVPWMLSADAEQLPAVRRLDLPAPMPPPASERVRVATLNIAHGRGPGYGHQLTTSRARMAEHLRDIGDAVGEEAVHCLALQEVDHRAWWSGGRSQAAVVARGADLPLIVRGNQVDRLGLRYGTALLGTGDFAEPRAVAFTAGPASPGKGFVSARWQLGDGRAATVISLHLHFRGGGRQSGQLRDLRTFIDNRPGPFIVMGDFNAEWRDGTGPVAAFAEALGLTTWDATAAVGTLRESGRRIDWILVSPPLRIVDQRVIDRRLSDHRMVVADLAWPLPVGE